MKTHTNAILPKIVQIIGDNYYQHWINKSKKGNTVKIMLIDKCKPDIMEKIVNVSSHITNVVQKETFSRTLRGKMFYQCIFVYFDCEIKDIPMGD
jgi:hypothetical protein